MDARDLLVLAHVLEMGPINEEDSSVHRCCTRGEGEASDGKLNQGHPII
jgi:hypothetical protein